MTEPREQQLYTSEVFIDGKWKTIGPSKDSVYTYNNEEIAYTSTQKAFPGVEVRVVPLIKDNSTGNK
jgi:hypothetical protein